MNQGRLLVLYEMERVIPSLRESISSRMRKIIPKRKLLERRRFSWAFGYFLFIIKFDSIEVNFRLWTRFPVHQYGWILEYFHIFECSVKIVFQYVRCLTYTSSSILYWRGCWNNFWARQILSFLFEYKFFWVPPCNSVRFYYSYHMYRVISSFSF